MCNSPFSHARPQSNPIRISRAEHATYAFQQGQSQHDIDDPVMTAIEFLDQESAANPGERGNRPNGCNQEFHSDQDPQCLAVRCDKSRQRRNAEHIDLDIDKLQQESLPERSRSLLCTDLRPADRNVNRKPEDVRSSNILHDQQGMDSRCASFPAPPTVRK